MMVFSITDDTNEPVQFKADSRDVLVWEKTSRKNLTFMNLLSGLSMQELYRLAHIAARRQGLFSGSLDDFEQSFQLEVEEDKSTTPTNAEASTET